MIVVIGAGVCGLAAAYELSRRGERAIALERGEPFAEQSAGLGRIFRIAHRRPELCALALEARAGWQRWEAELGAGRLLGVEGFIAAGPREGTAAAMQQAVACSPGSTGARSRHESHSSRRHRGFGAAVHRGPSPTCADGFAHRRRL